MGKITCKLLFFLWSSRLIITGSCLISHYIENRLTFILTLKSDYTRVISSRIIAYLKMSERLICPNKIYRETILKVSKRLFAILCAYIYMYTFLFFCILFLVWKSCMFYSTLFNRIYFIESIVNDHRMYW